MMFSMPSAAGMARPEQHPCDIAESKPMKPFDEMFTCVYALVKYRKVNPIGTSPVTESSLSITEVPPTGCITKGTV
jgi:hypothetical protein